MKIHITQLDDITIPENRIRRDIAYDKLALLADSIESKGILHPPVLRETPDGLQLVAGERRLRAMRVLHIEERPFHCSGTPIEPGTIPYLLLGELDEILVREAELEENVCRVDISWQEQAQAVSELHALRKELDPKHTVRRTASEIIGDDIDVSHPKYMAINRLRILGDNLANEQIAKAENPATAMKLLKRMAERDLSNTFAEYVAIESAPKENLVFQHRDGLEAMAELEDIDCIATDPPYGVSADTFGNYTSIIEHEYDDSAATYEDLMRRFAPLSYQCTNCRAHLYLFFDIRHWEFLRNVLSAEGWVVWPWPLIWVKHQGGLAPRPEHGPQRMYETILFANKGDRPVTGLYPDIIRSTVVRNKLHAAQKPVEVMDNILRRCVRHPAETVLDPFAGSGSTIIAAKRLGVYCYAYELDEVTFNRALVNLTLVEKEGLDDDL